MESRLSPKRMFKSFCNNERRLFLCKGSMQWWTIRVSRLISKSNRLSPKCVLKRARTECLSICFINNIPLKCFFMKSIIMLYFSSFPSECIKDEISSLETVCVLLFWNPRVIEGAQEQQIPIRHMLTNSKLFIGVQGIVFFIREMILRVILLVFRQS